MADSESSLAAPYLRAQTYRIAAVPVPQLSPGVRQPLVLHYIRNSSHIITRHPGSWTGMNAYLSRDQVYCSRVVPIYEDVPGR